MESRITKDTIEYIAELARIALTEDEKNKLVPDFNTILVRMDELFEIDTEGVVPCKSVTEVKNICREDSVGECLTKKDLLSNAPSHNDDFFIVPETVKQS